MTSEERIAREVERQRAAAERRMEKARQAAEAAEQRAREKVQAEENRMRLVTNSVATVLNERPWFDTFEALAQAAYSADGATQDPYFGDRTRDRRGKAKGFERFQRAMRSQLASEILDAQGVVIYSMRGLGAGVPGRGAVEDYEQRVNLQIERQIARINERRERVNRALGTEIPKVQVGLLTDGRESS